MKLIDNPGRVLRRAWSMWMAYAAILFAMLEAMQPELVALLPALQPWLGERAFALASLVATVLIPAARIIDQGIKAGQQAAEGVRE